MKKIVKSEIKKQLIMKSKRNSKIIQEVLQEFHFLQKAKSSKLIKKEIKKPFEDATSLELLSKKLNASMFIYGSHSKKRPHNLILGRMFEHQILDMFEVGINAKTFKSSLMLTNRGYNIGTHPAILFHGEYFSTLHLKRLRNLLLDILKGERVSIIDLSKLDRIIMITAISNKKILFRQYKINKHKSSTNIPQVNLKEIGPSIDFSFRRCTTASEELQILAYRNEEMPKTKNNEKIKVNGLSKRIHLKQQNFREIIKLSLKKNKAFKKTRNR